MSAESRRWTLMRHGISGELQKSNRSALTGDAPDGRSARWDHTPEGSGNVWRKWAQIIIRQGIRIRIITIIQRPVTRRLSHILARCCGLVVEKR